MPNLETRWIRWIIEKDFPEVLELAKQNPDVIWTEQDLLDRLKQKQKNCVAMLCERGDIIEAFIVYELHPDRFHILNLVVREDLRHQGIGREMVAKLIGKLHPEHRNRITLTIPEDNLTGQVFFRSLGFRAIQTIKATNANERDTYVMRYKTNP